MGRLVDTFERRYNRPELSPAMRRADGMSIVFSSLIMALAVGFVFEILATLMPYGWLVEVAVIATLFSLRPHLDHSRILAEALERDVAEARATLALTTGRDAHRLDEVGIARAGIETSAISFAEGILTPGIYFLMFGVPGLFAFKIINVGANIIDVRSTDFADFGNAFCRMNSIFLWPGIKLAVIFISLSALFTKPSKSFTALVAGFGKCPGFFRPHLGAPVAALASALNIRLGGPICFEEKTIEGNWLNENAPEPLNHHMLEARSIFFLASMIVVATLVLFYNFDIWMPADSLRSFGAWLWSLFTS